MMVQPKTLSLLGCGLMGGSFALAAQQAGLFQHIIGYSVPQDHADAFLAQGIIHSVANNAALAVTNADVVLLAAPVNAIPLLLKEIAETLPEQALVMDVGSTKRSIQQAAEQLLGNKYGQFIGAHPIAGKEKAGPSAPFASLYKDKTVILCPDTKSNPQQLELATSLWQAIGAKPLSLSAITHDRGLAAVSHLPHLIAFAFMDALLNQADHADLLALGGPGFRDFSRIAGCEPSIWRDILTDNQDQILPLLDAVRHSLDQFQTLITQQDKSALEPLLQRASQTRIHWN